MNCPRNAVFFPVTEELLKSSREVDQNPMSIMQTQKVEETSFILSDYLMISAVGTGPLQ